MQRYGNLYAILSDLIVFFDGREAFCSPFFVQFANANLVVWVGSIQHAEAYNLSHVLKAAKFPFTALLNCQSRSTVQLVDRIQGIRQFGFLACIQENIIAWIVLI